MKIAKLSLAALMALGVSAFAEVQNIKVSGDAKLFYGTQDADYEQVGARPARGDLFSDNDSYGQAALNIGVTANLADSVQGKVALTALSTLGLENNLVSQVWAGQTTNTVWWASEAWLAKTFSKTTVKVGRQELDTPLAFSEKWNIATNTFDAIVVLNQDLPETTLVGAYVGRGNGVNGMGVVRTTDNDGNTSGDFFRTYGSAIDDTLETDLASGAYAAGIITTAIPNTTAQAWYYNVNNIATAYWLQADVNLKDVLAGLIFGLQYANLNPDNKVDAAAGTSVDSSSGWGAKIGFDFKDALPGLKACVAYSSTDEDGAVSLSNTATGLTGESKLYTEAWWNYGYVARPSTDTWSVKVKYDMKDVAEFGAFYTSADQDTGKFVDTPADMTEFALTASKNFGSLNATVAYIYTDADDLNVNPATNQADSFNTIQLYLTYNF